MTEPNNVHYVNNLEKKVKTLTEHFMHLQSEYDTLKMQYNEQKELESLRIFNEKLQAMAFMPPKITGKSFLQITIILPLILYYSIIYEK